jgi:DNA invertase Pin-like site-specific DNA recombinase
MKIGYVRVSPTNQNLDVQIKQLEAIGCEKIYQEKLVGIPLIVD